MYIFSWGTELRTFNCVTNARISNASYFHLTRSPVNRLITGPGPLWAVLDVSLDPGYFIVVITALEALTGT